MQYRLLRRFENLNLAMFDGVGPYGIPQLEPTQTRPESFVGFNAAATCSQKSRRCVHFFIDDYMFARVWSQPEKQAKALMEYQCVTSPDYSLYTDIPLAMQIFNHYKKHWCGAFWHERYGIDVIPTVCWSDEASWEWCFDGEPKNSVVACSSVGSQADDESKRLFNAGFAEMVRRLDPTCVLFFGAIPDGCVAREIVRVPSYQEMMRARINGGGV